MSNRLPLGCHFATVVAVNPKDKPFKKTGEPGFWYQHYVDFDVDGQTFGAEFISNKEGDCPFEVNQSYYVKVYSEGRFGNEVEPITKGEYEFDKEAGGNTMAATTDGNHSNVERQMISGGFPAAGLSLTFATGYAKDFIVGLSTAGIIQSKEEAYKEFPKVLSLIHSEMVRLAGLNIASEKQNLPF
jgi:hypothetical protein